ncbi:MAG TPA: C_GCAxxG_C_C family protein [Candidatus Cloacimonetes bacterium]|nr:C_GCAxxG_C_C family protein [Candidatus Cloacimonadota bacterium]
MTKELTKLQKAALALFEAKLNCAQSVFTVFAESFGLSQEQALKISSTFGGGMSVGSSCGAMTGGLMALGLALGYTEHDEETKESFSNLTEEYVCRFSKRFESMDCREIKNPHEPELKDLPEEEIEAILRQRCVDCVLFAVSLTENMLQENAPLI